jgi:hypothetical protein
MNTRLKIICILFGIAYFFIISEHIVRETFPIFKAGFLQGWREASEQASDRPNDETCYFDVEPKAGVHSYPSSFLNLKTGTWFNAEVVSFRAKIQNPVKLPTGLVIAEGLGTFLGLFALFLLLYIPVQAYKVIRSMVKNEIFDVSTINRIRKIGYALLIIFGYSACMGVVLYSISRNLIDLEDYNNVFSLKEDYIFLLFGLIILLFAEILKISHTMKEEVDLTV